MGPRILRNVKFLGFCGPIKGHGMLSSFSKCILVRIMILCRYFVLRLKIQVIYRGKSALMLWTQFGSPEGTFGFLNPKYSWKWWKLYLMINIVNNFHRYIKILEKLRWKTGILTNFHIFMYSGAQSKNGTCTHHFLGFFESFWGHLTLRFKKKVWCCCQYAHM